MKMKMEVRKESPSAEQATQLTVFLSKRLPKNPLIKNPIAGNRGINQT
jgi:hypothetical protein